MGFMKAFELAEMSQLTQFISKFKGILWLITTVLFGATIILFYFGYDWWWIIGLISIVFSQFLIYRFWQDARFGTIANVIILIVCIFGYGDWQFNRMVQSELNSFIPKSLNRHEIINQGAISQLPSIVQKWLIRCDVVGKNKIQTVHLNQKGEMRTALENKWMPVVAEQWFTTEEPGFIWNADVGTGTFMQFSGRDKYQNGKGHMVIKLYSLFPVANSKGTEIDQGVLVRYLSEIIWFPTAVLEDYLVWEEIEPLKAMATMNYGGLSVSGVFSFNAEGDVLSFEAQRYYDRKEGATLETWFIDIDENSNKTFNGIRIPTKATVTWKLSSGDFTWFNLEIKKVRYNIDRQMTLRP